MAQDFIRLPSDAANTGKRMDAWTTATQGYYREAIVVADPSVDAAVASVLDADPAANAYALPVREIYAPAMAADLDAIAADADSINTILLDVYDSVNHRLDVAVLNTVTITGTVTANAGTDLNTSLLALESGGNLATLAGIVASARAAVNLIVGEAGITAAAGNVAANTPRLTLAADDPGVTSLAAILAVLGATNGAAVITDANGTIQQYLRGLIKQWIAGTLVVGAGASGGWTPASGSIGATATDIGAANTPGQIGGWFIFNPNASTAYVQFFNTQASGVTVGTTPPVYSLGIPAGSAANIQPGAVGIAHSTAICIAVTTTRAGSTGPASTVDYNLFYKQ